MTQINLLPWRQRARTERKQQFLLALLAGGLLAIMVLMPIYVVINSMINNQKGYNHFLLQEIHKLDRQITEIKEMQKDKEKLLARMNIIQQLQRDRSRIVQIFDDFVHLIPDGIYYSSIAKKGDKFIITGVADSNASISRLMRNIEGSRWLAQPTLKQIDTETRDGNRLANFQLEMQLK